MDSPEIFTLQHETRMSMGRYRSQASAYKTLEPVRVAVTESKTSEGCLGQKAAAAAADSNIASSANELHKQLDRPSKQQALLNFGQKRLYSKRCEICGMVYQTGHREDEATHAKQCRAATDRPSVTIPPGCKQLAPSDCPWAIFELLPKHCATHASSITAVLECLQRDLGMHSVQLSARKLYVATAACGATPTTSRPHDVIGAILVEPVSQAQRAMPLAFDTPPSPPPASSQQSGQLPTATGSGRQSGALQVYGSARKRPRADAASEADAGNTSLVTDPSPPRAPAAAAAGSANTHGSSSLVDPGTEKKTTKTLLSFFKSAKPGGAEPAPPTKQVQGPSTHKSVTAPSVTGAHGATFRVASVNYPATLGVLQVWTHTSHRRQGVASALLNTARGRAVFGQVVPKEEVAFSQPTSAGHAFASAFAGRRDHLLYA